MSWLRPILCEIPVLESKTKLQGIARRVTVMGVNYPSINKACKALGISRYALEYKLGMR